MVRLARERDLPNASFSVADLAEPLDFLAAGDYHATELLTDRWEKGGREFEVRFWRRPLSAMFDAIAEAGFQVERVSEPQPLEECRERFPHAWERLTTRPWFLFFRLRA